MERVRVRSSDLAEVGYDPFEGILEIKFRSGATYVYFNVPVHVYEGLLRAGSKRSYFHRNIKDRYRTRRGRAG